MPLDQNLHQKYATILLHNIPANIKMSFIWKDDFFLPKSALSVSRSQAHFPALFKRIHNHIRSVEGRIKLIIWTKICTKQWLVVFSIYACGFSVPQMPQFCLFTYPPRSKWASKEVSRSAHFWRKIFACGPKSAPNSDSFWVRRLFNVWAAKIKMSFIWKDDFFFWQKRHLLYGDRRHTSQRCSSICTTIFVWRTLN